MSNDKTRAGIKDIWNAFMADGAKFDNEDIPFCPTTALDVPKALISWKNAVNIYYEKMKRKQFSFHVNAFIHFYQDDQVFDGDKKGIWVDPWRAFEIIRHFDGIITPDFSTYLDFPDPLLRYQTYRIRIFGYWIERQGIQVINNVRWGKENTWVYCYKGISQYSTVAIGTVGSRLSKKKNLRIFEAGLYQMVRELSPQRILVYGSANYRCFEVLRSRGIEIIAFEGETSLYFSGRKQQ